MKADMSQVFIKYFELLDDFNGLVLLNMQSGRYTSDHNKKIEACEIN